jgi:ribosomal protein S18 acetylase RimI-like enzyme
VSNVVVREAKPDEIERVIHVQTLAFCADPVMRWLYPEPQAYLRHFPDFAEAFGARAFEHSMAWIAGDFGGAGMWLPPGVESDSERLEAIVKESIDDARRDTAFAVMEEIAKAHIEESHWYLPMIGVDPARQGQGMGSALLRHALAKCDEAGFPAYLESSSPANVPLYERHGFRVTQQIQIENAPPIFPMLRDAR